MPHEDAPSEMTPAARFWCCGVASVQFGFRTATKWTKPYQPAYVGRNTPHARAPCVSSAFIRLNSLLLLATALFAAPAGSQQIALRDLPKPTREIDEPFSFVTGAIEFKGGQLIVADGAEGTLAVVDFARGTRTPLGRQGSGPGEYRTPAGLFRLQGDTIWVLDATQMRMVAFNPDLTPGTGFPFIMFDQQTGTALAAPFFSDPRGRLYASAMSIQAGRNGGGASIAIPDTVAVVRVDPRDKTARVELSRVRFPTSGKPEMKQQGNAFKYTMAYPGWSRPIRGRSFPMAVSPFCAVPPTPLNSSAPMASTRFPSGSRTSTSR